MTSHAFFVLFALLPGAALAQPMPQSQSSPLQPQSQSSPLQPQSPPQPRTLATTAHARELAATCAACHTRGGAADAAIPALDGRPAADTAAALRAYKSDARAGTVMPQLARGYSDADIDAIAQWYAANPR